MPHCLTKKRPAKKFFFPKKKFFSWTPFAADGVQGGCAHGEKGSKWKEPAVEAQIVYRKRARDF